MTLMAFKKPLSRGAPSKMLGLLVTTILLALLISPT